MVDRVRMRRLQDDWIQERYGYRLDEKDTTAWRMDLTEEERALVSSWDAEEEPQVSEARRKAMLWVWIGDMNMIWLEEPDGAWRANLTEDERRLLGRWDQVTPTEEINALHSEDVDVDVLRTVLSGEGKQAG